MIGRHRMPKDVVRIAVPEPATGMLRGGVLELPGRLARHADAIADRLGGQIIDGAPLHDAHTVVDVAPVAPDGLAQPAGGACARPLPDQPGLPRRFCILPPHDRGSCLPAPGSRRTAIR